MNQFKLWYSKPASSWDEALPLGNGRIGAMVFGIPEKERIQMNEESVWYGGSRDRNNPEALKYLPEIRKLILDGKISQAEELAKIALSGIPESQRHYQPLGDLFVEFGKIGHFVQEYKRELDLATGISSVSYVINGVKYYREFFISAVHQIMVCNLWTDSSEDKVNCKIYLRRGRDIETSNAFSDGNLILKANCGGEAGNRLIIMVNVAAESGAVQAIGENIIVNNESCITLRISTRTTYNNKIPEQICADDINNSCKYTYDELKHVHIEEYSSYYNRVYCSFGKTDSNIEKLPTDERLKSLSNGVNDPDLIAMYLQFGRYCMLSSSRPGTLPANLQGIWNNNFYPPWDSKYTININTEMNYWLAEPGNLSECHQPLFDHIERMRIPGRVTARVMYNCKGFMAHHNTDIWADTAPQDIYIPATYWPMGAAWLCLHIWDHYEYTLDKVFLEKAYPVMKEAAEFFTEFLIEDRNGRLVTCPSVSPENTYIMDDGTEGCLCAGPAMDLQIVKSLFDACIKAGSVLDTDHDFSKKLNYISGRLIPINVGSDGRLMEWIEEYREKEPGHRHISHLFALYPGELISKANTPSFAEAAEKSLRMRLMNGSGHTGWSRAWIVNLWARLENGDEAYYHLIQLLSNSTLPNLFNTHPPFQIDGNFGGAAGIIEMLVQSHSGCISLLPALPSMLPEGVIKGICGKGGFTVDIEWANMKLKNSTITSKCGNICKLKTALPIGIYNKNIKIKSTVISSGIIEFETEQNENYIVLPD